MKFMQSQVRRIGIALFSIMILFALVALPDSRQAEVAAAQCPPIAVAPGSIPGAALGVTYSQTFTASGGQSPYTFTRSAGALPPGLFLNSGGGLGGTPSALGNYNFTIRATDSNGCTGSRSYSILVVCPGITLTQNLPGASLGVQYSQTIVATGGDAPYTYSITAGSLPPGMFLGSGGGLGGTPNTLGNYNFTIRATDSNGCTGTRSYSILVVCPSITVTPNNLPAASLGAQYSQNINASGGDAPYTYSISAGSLPPGMFLGSGGGLGGTPNTLGNYNFTIRATDSNGCTGSRAYTINVNCPDITLNPVSLPGGHAGAFYSQNLSAVGGQSPYSYLLFLGSLPPGLTLSASGTISGTPTTPGSYGFTFRARDANNCFGLRAYTIVIAPACPTITLNPATLPNPLTGVPYSQTIMPTGGQEPYSFSLISGILPVGGLSLSPTTGVISGTPAFTFGIYSFTVRATDANGCYGSRTYTIEFGCPTINIATDNINATAGASFLQTIFASGQTTPFTFSFAAPTAPAWLNLSTTGVVTGTPPAAGTYSFGVRATDANGCSATKTITITASCPTITINPTSLPTGTVGSAYSRVVSASGGTAPYLFGTNISALPPGLTLNTNGTLSGTPTTAGSYNFIIRGNDANGCFGERSYTLVIANPTCPTITVNPPGILSGRVGQSYSWNFAANGGLSPYTFSLSAGTLPAGLTFAPNVISGTPTEAGSFLLTLRATDANGCIGERQYTLQVSCPTITLSPTSLPVGTTGVAYSQVVSATGGTAPYAFSIVSGTLPAGISLATNGTLSGTPTASGTYTFNLQASDAYGCTVARTLALVVNNPICPTVTVAPSTLPNGVTGVAYAQTITASGGTATYAFSISSGALPPGLSLATNGALSGTPTTTGSYSFSVRATDANGCTGARGYVVAIGNVSCPTITLNPSALSNGAVGSAYNQTLSATGGTAAYAFSIASGNLPPGISLSATGNLTGTPTMAGSYNFRTKATDANGCIGERDYTIVINNAACPTITVTPASLPTATVGATYSQAFSATGGVGTYKFRGHGSIPPGLTPTPSGNLSGMPTTPGSYSFTVIAEDANGCTGERSYTLTVNAPACPTITINQTGLPPGIVGAAYNQTLTVTGGVSPHTFAVSTGNLPAGLMLNSTNGTILGTLTTAGVYNFAVRVTDINGCVGERSFTLVISANLVTSVSAASFIAGGTLAPESIVATFGTNLATNIHVATTTTLPTELGGVSLKIKDSAGIERLAPLFFVSPTQLNHQMPAGMALGTAVVTVLNGANVVATGSVEITNVAPGLFAADASGRGLASAVALRVRSNGVQSFEPVVRFDAALGRFVAEPIDVSNPLDQVFLVFYGTGWKLRTSLAAVNCVIGGVTSDVLYAGEVPGFVGYDQLNAKLSPSLAGLGEVDVIITVDGKTANTLRVAIR